ncbi:hypothetical protein JZ751_016569 [Albula glossodonta]|uniref:NAD(P)H oxidase (H2O2-forming) n=1 Tax=Albula glossodonta TaxID=121402 RepID=A0A8T2N2M3_9TELE|nr:hypothetical protein JZ751_016569 [Albula glossodonta]
MNPRSKEHFHVLPLLMVIFILNSASSPMTRLLPAHYSDGVYQPVQEPWLPNPREISNVATKGPSGLPSSQNLTVLSVFFGYHVVYEIVDSRQPGCPPEFMHIPIPRGDPVFDPDSSGNVLLPFQRGKWAPDTSQSPNNPRNQVNHVTAWMDGSSIYGSSSSWCDALRSFSGGRLEAGPEGDLPKRSRRPYFMWNSVDPSTGHHGRDGLYEFGNARGNENVFTAAEGIVWFRYHNYLASTLQKQHPLWSDEELFQSARKRVVATFQGPQLHQGKHGDNGADGRLPEARGPRGFAGISGSRHTNPNLQKGSDIDDIIMGMASQIAEKEDNIIVEDLRDYMYGPMTFSRSDLVAMTVQRGRDNGLPTYNQARAALSLEPVTRWGDINPELNATNPQLFRDLADLYGNDLSKLELFPGGLLESSGAPGPLFSAIILDQFQRIRDGDRYWFENNKNGTTFHDVLLAVTAAEPGDIQDNIFIWKDGDPCPQPGQVLTTDLHPCTNATARDYFDGSRVGFGITVAALFLFPPVSFLLAYVVAYYRKRKFRRYQRKQRNADNREEPPAVGVTACEWAGPKQALRPVGLEMDAQRRWLRVTDSAGSTLRSLNLNSQGQLDILLSSDRRRQALLLKIPKEYDLVLFFEDESKRSDFVGWLSSELTAGAQGVRVREVGEQELLREAVTREQREQIMEIFFRHAFAQVLEIDKRDAGDLSSVAPNRTREALHCELSREEFAQALGLKPESLFVESMFALADKDGNGYLSFQEFLDVIVIFMKGSPEEKSKLMFNMHDISGNGFLSKEEFSRLLRSFIEISSNCLSKSQAEQAIEAMLGAAGFNDKEQITWEDFHFLLRDHEKELRSQGEEENPLAYRALEPDGPRRRMGRKEGLHSPKVYVKPKREAYSRSRVQQRVQQFKRFVENYRRHIVCFCVIYGITAGVTLERCYHYGLQATSTGIPETTAVGIVVSRGTAAAVSFQFPYMLLTVCRNLITLGRETFLNRYIPFDAAIDLHRWMAMSAIVLTVIHSLGHVVNVYILSVSNLSILSCLFPKVFLNDG